jgi:hypothetical protein
MHYQPGARWQPRPISAGKGLLELMNHTVPARSRPELALNILQQLLPRARHLKGVRGEAEETAAALLQSLSPATD